MQEKLRTSNKIYPRAIEDTLRPLNTPPRAAEDPESESPAKTPEERSLKIETLL